MEWNEILLKTWGFLAVISVILLSYQGNYISKDRKGWDRFWLYVVVGSAFIALLSLFQKGFAQIVSSDWGSITEDGDWIPYSHTLGLISAGMLLQSLHDRELLKKKIALLEEQVMAECTSRRKVEQEVTRLSVKLTQHE